MGFVTTKTLVCDRCGYSVPATDKMLSSLDFKHDYPGWTQVGRDRALCPDCAPGYDLLLSRHKVELEDYIQGDSK